MENELSVMTGRGWITLSEEQKEIIKDVQEMNLDCDQSGNFWGLFKCLGPQLQSGNHEGSFIFLEGEKGSGKTVLGLEVGRIIKNKRNLIGAEYNKTCSLIFSAPDISAGSLLTTIGEKSMKIEQQFSSTSVETFYEEYKLGEYNVSKTSPVEVVTKILRCLRTALAMNARGEVRDHFARVHGGTFARLARGILAQKQSGGSEPELVRRRCLLQVSLAK